MRRSLGVLAALTAALSLQLSALSPVYCQEVGIPEAGPSLLNPHVQAFLKDFGPSYGLAGTPEGQLTYSKPDMEGAKKERALSPVTSERLLSLMAGVPKDRVEGVMAEALTSYLQARMGPTSAKYMQMLFETGPDGKRRLTQIGRNVLMDILTAEDGLDFKLPDGQPEAKKETRVSALKVLRAMEKAGVLILGKMGGAGEFSAAGVAGGFDGSIRQGVYGLEGFDWAGQGDPVLIRKSRDANGIYLQTVPGPLGSASQAPKSETLRILIAAKNPVAIDRLKVADAADRAAILREAGLDAGLIERSGATVVRAVDNLIAVDVPLPKAQELGLGLREQGIVSRPARAFKMAVDAIRSGPRWPDPLHALLPIASGDASSGQAVEPQNLASSDILKVGAMHAKGMDGAGTTVAIVDSGLDVGHPDFEDRVAAYIDLTDSGTKDFVGHGTHVAGSVGGSGAMSQGRHKGMAPKTKFVILKVFGQEGSASEDTIIAAMKAARSLPKEIRPQVMNLSLGGPGDPETDPLSALANEMMVKDNILMAVAAGNSGPGKKTIGAPGNARYVMTVTGTNKQRTFPFFPSRGPVTTSKGVTYNKPDISAISGDVSASNRLRLWFKRAAGKKVEESADDPSDPGCFYAPGGVISTRSKDDTDAGCVLKNNPQYRYMSGTSMATPLAAGVAADVIGYLNSKGKAYKATEVKALMMETAATLKEKPDVQGAGLIDGEKLAKVLEERVAKGLPVGNVAFALSSRLSAWDAFNMTRGGRFERTPLGILDKKTGHLIHTDSEFEAMAGRMTKDFKQLPMTSRLWRRLSFWFES